MSSNSPDSSVFRIIDAASNRAAEGLRVVEDYLRMHFSDGHLAAQAKQLRHDLTSALTSIEAVLLIAARDSQNDVGRSIETVAEYERDNLDAVVKPNLARVQQAVRTIEEVAKTFSKDLARSIEEIRYQSYSFEKAVLTTIHQFQNLDAVRLCVLVDGRGSADELVALAAQLIAAQVGMIQLRDKRLTDRDLVVAGTRLGELTAQSDTVWIMNDRADLALAANADGVHLGQDDIVVADARRILGPAKLIGVSCHTIEQARSAVMDGASYLGVGPTFPSQTKTFESFAGLELVQQVAAEIKLPAFAIGGIHHENVSAVVQAGLPRVAVRHAVINSEDPFLAARELKSRLI